ncbi:MAG: hypothetical protein HQ461_00155 [Deltaproteobacteria bacterium]|nr:hypothetical protein [Deltaproteobacteria bacterium]
MSSANERNEAVHEAHVALWQGWQAADARARAVWPGPELAASREVIAAAVLHCLSTTKLGFRLERSAPGDAAEVARRALIAAAVLRLSSRGKPPEMGSNAVGYLYRVVSNLIADQGRAQRPSKRVSSEGPSGLEEVIHEEQEPAFTEEQLQQAREGLRRFLVQFVVAQARSDNQLVQSFDRLWQIQTGLVRLEELVREVAESEREQGAAADIRKVTNRFHRGHTDVRAKLLRELVGQLDRLTRADGATATSEQRKRVEDYAFWLQLVAGILRDRSASRRPARLSTASTNPVTQGSMEQHPMEDPTVRSNNASAMDNVVVALTRAGAFLDRPYRRAGEPVAVGLGHPKHGTGRGYATAELWEEEEATTIDAGAAAATGWLDVADLSGLYSQPFLLTREDGVWRVIPRRRQAGQATIHVVSLTPGAERTLQRAHVPEEGIAIERPNDEPVACIARYHDGGAGILIRLDGESSMVQLVLPPAEHLSCQPPEVALAAPLEELLEDPLLLDGISLLHESGPFGRARAAAALLRIVGPSALVAGPGPSDAEWFVGSMLQGTDALRRGLAELVETIDPEDEQWVCLATQLLEVREEVEGLLELAGWHALEISPAALHAWDNEARYVYAALPTWTPGPEADWVLAVRGASALGASGDEACWWLDFVWDL